MITEIVKQQCIDDLDSGLKLFHGFSIGRLYSYTGRLGRQDTYGFNRDKLLCSFILLHPGAGKGKNKRKNFV